MTGLKVIELGEYLREQRQSAKLSLRQLAEAAGVSNPYLSQIERGVRRPSAEVLQQIAKGLRISAEVLYVRAGILDERVDQVEVRSAILADVGLTERQRQTLVDIYEAFRAETSRRRQAEGSTAPERPDAERPDPDHLDPDHLDPDHDTRARALDVAGTPARETAQSAVRVTEATVQKAGG